MKNLRILAICGLSVLCSLAAIAAPGCDTCADGPSAESPKAMPGTDMSNRTKERGDRPTRTAIAGTTRTIVNYALPALTLVRENNVQRKLAHSLEPVHLVSISSDPEEDTPVTLLRTAPGQPSVRFDGLVAADEPLKKSRVVAR